MPLLEALQPLLSLPELSPSKWVRVQGGWGAQGGPVGDFAGAAPSR